MIDGGLIVDSTDRRKAEMLNQFFSMAYDHGTFVWAQPVEKRNRQCWSTDQSSAKKTFFRHQSSEGVYLAINATKDRINRNKDSCILRSFLLEFDQDDQGNEIDWAKQLLILEHAGLIPSAVIFSGGKSLHFWFILETPLTQIGEYTEWWIRLSILCGRKCDLATRDPSRFSRFPTARRGDCEQELLFVGYRQDNEVLKSRLFNETVDKKYVELMQGKSVHNGYATFRTAPRSIESCVKMLCEYHPLETGVKQSNLLVWAKTLVGSGGLTNIEQIVSIIAQYDNGKNKLRSEYERVAQKALDGLSVQQGITDSMWGGSDGKWDGTDNQEYY